MLKESKVYQYWNAAYSTSYRIRCSPNTKCLSMSSFISIRAKYWCMMVDERRKWEKVTMCSLNMTIK